MEIKVLKQSFSVCQIKDVSEVNFKDEFCFLGKTDEELSLVCDTKYVPQHTANRDDGWRGFRIQGVLDFSLIGILSKISGILADEEIGIFAVSTYNTDYILIKEESLDQAVAALKNAGYDIVY